MIAWLSWGIPALVTWWIIAGHAYYEDEPEERALASAIWVGLFTGILWPITYIVWACFKISDWRDNHRELVTNYCENCRGAAEKFLHKPRGVKQREAKRLAEAKEQKHKELLKNNRKMAKELDLPTEEYEEQTDKQLVAWFDAGSWREEKE